jgi:hypothetical protein
MNAFRRVLLSLASCAALLAALALTAGAEEPGRFVLKETDRNSVVRLDTFTGAVSHCASAAGEWSCKSVKDDRAELHEEIAKLRKENAALKTRLAEARDVAPESPLALPSEADLDRIMALFERYFERFLAFIRKLEQKQEDKAI